MMALKFRQTWIALAILVAQWMALPATGRGEDVDALSGEWKIVEMVFKGKPQVSNNGSLGWIRFGPKGFSIADHEHRYGPDYPCTLKDQALDITLDDHVLKALIEHKNASLRIVWRDDVGERPTDFDALSEPKLTLYVLEKCECDGAAPDNEPSH